MLDTLRKSASGFVGFFLIGLLVVAFGLWGIADTFTGFSNAVLAKVGEEEIERNEFQARYLQQIQIVQQELGSAVDQQQAKDLGLDKQVLRTMLGSAALRAASGDMGLAISDDKLATMIISDPAFAAPNGEFDEPTFRMALRRSGLTEELFVDDQRDFHVRGQLTSAALDRALMPSVLQTELFRHFLERRTAKYVILTLDQTEEVGEPTQEELESFYNATQLRFTEGERRTASVLAITPDRFAESITFSDDELREEYEMSLDEFSIEEERAIDQLVLSDETVIDDVRALIAAKASFIDIVAAANQNLDNTDLGTIKRRDMISAKLADRAFELAEGDVSDIIDGPLGAVVLRVRSIKPGVITPFEDVVDELRRRLVIERAVDDMLAFSETVEDERAAGSSLEEIGQRFDLEVATFENFDRNGTLSDGSRATPLRSFDGLIDNLFESLIGEDLPMLETADGSFVWARLSDIQPSRVPPLADVRAQAIAQWKVSEKAKLLEALAEHLVSQGNNQDSFSKITKGLNLTPLTSDPMTRQVSNETFSTQAVEKLFTLEENKFAWARAGFGSDLVVMQALNITQAKPSDSSEARDLIFSGELRKYHADITDQLIRSLQSTYGIEIFEDNLEQALTQLVAR